MAGRKTVCDSTAAGLYKRIAEAARKRNLKYYSCKEVKEEFIHNKTQEQQQEGRLPSANTRPIRRLCQCSATRKWSRGCVQAFPAHHCKYASTARLEARCASSCKAARKHVCNKRQRAMQAHARLPAGLHVLALRKTDIVSSNTLFAAV